LLNHQVKFKNWYMLVLSQYHKFESYKINIYSVVVALSVTHDKIQTESKMVAFLAV
jgi:hypothetical protein